MRLRNQSRLDTRALHAFISEVAKREGYDRPGYLSGLLVRVSDSRKRHHGHASMGGVRWGASDFSFGRSMSLFVPPVLQVATFAAVISHEMAHNHGVPHRNMAPGLRYCRPLDWARDRELPVRTKGKPKPTPDDKLTHAMRMQKAAATRARRATTILKKWDRRVRLYQSKIAAGGAE